MRTKFFVTGTDTEVGKTVVSAMLTAALDGIYWKPIQSGIDSNDYGATDRERVQRMGGISEKNTLPEAYFFEHPLSPHAASEIEGVDIDPRRLRPAVEELSSSDRPLIMEGAGGLMVPLSKQVLLIDALAGLRVPVILVARTRLGTINHTLLSIEALKQREIPIHGIVFNGDENSDTQLSIARFAKVPVLGRVPTLPEINRDSLLDVFEKEFRHQDFESSSEQMDFGVQFDPIRV